MSRAKRAALCLVTGLIVLATPVALVAGYYAVRKITFLYHYCGSYGVLDPLLGWRLAPEARSCLVGRNRLTGETYFDTRILIGPAGFRVAEAASASPPPEGAVAAIGDSWTFGYGVDQEESYPYRLSQLIARPVLNAGVPAYGAAQVLLRFERDVLPSRPRAAIYLTLGLWRRSVCERGAEPEDVLVPCFAQDAEAGRVRVVTPAPGRVDRMARQGIYPGGYLTAGFDSWSYFLISRPVLIARQAWGRLTGAGSAAAADQEPVLRFELERYRALARGAGLAFVLVDPEGSYAAAAAALGGDAWPDFAYVGPDRWRSEVAAPAAALPAAEQRVPKDGHFGPGANRLVAQMLATVLAEGGWLE